MNTKKFVRAGASISFTGLLGLAAVALLLSASPLSAEDMTYAGATCRNASGSLVPSFMSIVNTGTPAVLASCPGIHNNDSNFFKGYVYTSISTAWNLSSCSMGSTAFDGTSTINAGTPALAQVGNAYEFSWKNGLNTFGFGALGFQCNIPGGQKIFRYDLQR